MIKNISLLICLSFWAVSANAELIGRLPFTPGGTDFQAYYDTDADLTWLADANAAGTTMNWSDANAWAASLNVAGITGWRLPNTIDVGNDGFTYTNHFEGVDYGFNITTHSELSNMFYNVLDNTPFHDTSGALTGCNTPNGYTCLTNTGPFSNLQPNVYWSATEFAPDTSNAWLFVMSYGLQAVTEKSTMLSTWAVRTGDVSAVPIPSAVWLFGSGLVGLIGFARRKANA